MLPGMLLGAIVALVITFGQRWREQHEHSIAPLPKPSATATQVAWPAPQPIEKRLSQHTEQELWLQRRELEFDKCATLHGTPTLGFGMRVVCLDSHAVKFLGEEHPPYE